MKNFNFLIALLCFMLFSTWTYAQLSTSPSSDATALANSIVGVGISVSNATLNCPTGGSGTFSNGNSTNIGLDMGVMLSSGLISGAAGPNDSQNTTTDFSAAGDADLSALSGFPTYDACILEFDFEAVANVVSISYAFGSEEYLEFVNTRYNDVFGFLVSGPKPGGGDYINENIATIPENVPVTINSINHLVNTSYYVDNPPGAGTTIQYDGFTVVLTATLDIIPCETYHFKLAISDAGDYVLDSGVFLEEASFEASLECQDITLTLDSDGTGSISAEDLVASDLDACDFEFSISQSEFVCSDEGENTVTVTAVDDNGNELTCEAIVTVVVPEGILDIDYGADCRQVYLGYDPMECVDISADVTGGHSPYTYLWSTGETTQSINVCPEATTDYYVTVTDSNGCSEVAGPINVLVVDVRCGNNGNKVLLCHIPPGNPGNPSTICISPSSVPAHLAHGCFLGDCSETANPCNNQEGYRVPAGVVDQYQELVEPLIWPNPGTEELNVDLPAYVEGQVYIELRSPEGSILKSFAVKEGDRSGAITDLSKINDGIYYILIRDETGQQWMLKWLKATR